MASKRKRTRTTSSNATAVFKKSGTYVPAASYKKVVKFAENKYKDSDVGTYAPSSTGIVYCVSDVSQQTGIQNRIGNMIWGEKLLLNYAVLWDPAVSPGASCSVYVIQDMQVEQNTVPGMADIFDFYSQGNEFLNISNLGRFKILFQKEHYCDTAVKTVKFRTQIKLNFPIRYYGTGGTDNQKNSIYVCARGNYASTGQPAVQFNTRLLFNDS